MNIADILSNMRKSTENSLISRLETKQEIHRINRKADDLVESVINWYIEEYKYIDNNLSYSCGTAQRTLSEEDKKELIDKLNEIIKSIPSKIESQIKEISGTKEEKVEDKEEEKPSKEIEIEITKPAIPMPPPAVSNFGY